MEIKSKFDHFNINVTNLERSIAFYEKALSSRAKSFTLAIRVVSFLHLAESQHHVEHGVHGEIGADVIATVEVVQSSAGRRVSSATGM